MQCVTRPRITELNPHLLCVLCGGYYIDATAIIECLHSFCKSCIVRYLETRKYCPICDVLVHKTKPLQNLRPDAVLQSIVYKLVPNLYEKEMRNRRNYYIKVHPSLHPRNAEEKGVITELSNFYSSSDNVDFTLEYVNSSEDQRCSYVASSSRKYFRCQASVTVQQIRKLIEAKYALMMKQRVRFFYNEIQLPEHLTLLDIAYISSWKRNGFIRILYEIQLEIREKVTKAEPQPSLTTTAASSHVTPSSPLCTETSLVEKATKVTKSEDATENSANETDTTESAKEQSSIPSAVSTTTTDAIPSNPVIDKTDERVTPSCISTSSENVVTSCSVSTQNENTTTSSSMSTVINTSTSSVTVTCSMNSDNITVSLLGTPITTSVCEVPVNGLPPLQKNETTNQSLTQDEETSANFPNESSTKEPTEKPAQTTVTIEDKCEKHHDPAPPAKRPIVAVVEENTKPAPPRESSPTPAKVPKLSELVEKVQPIRKSALEVRTTICSISTASSATAVTYSMPRISPAGATKTNVPTVPMPPRMDCPVVRNSPRPIFARDVPMITKSTTKIMKTFTRPWNCTTTNPSSTADGSIDASNKSRSTKIIKARPTPPRFLGNISMCEATTLTMSSSSSSKPTASVDDAKKSSKIFPVMKIDPQTLSPIATTSACSVVPSSSSGAKKTYPYMPATSELYTSSGAFTSGGLSTYTSSSSLAGKPHASYVMPNPLLPINQLMYEMYGNGARTLEYMKAMTTNFCGPAMFHPSLHPSMSSFYGSLQKNSKYEKASSRGVKTATAVMTSDKSPPAVQRIPPSNNNTKLAINEHSSEKKHTPNVKHDIVSNGQLKNKSSKKTAAETSSFSINNLIPLEMGKRSPVSHSCSADGIHQMCDQIAQKNRDCTKSDCGETPTTNASTEKLSDVSKVSIMKKE